MMTTKKIEDSNGNFLKVQGMQINLAGLKETFRSQDEENRIRNIDAYNVILHADKGMVISLCERRGVTLLKVPIENIYLFN